jgi:membrane protein YqaA with SNARE-associated domain
MTDLSSPPGAPRSDALPPPAFTRRELWSIAARWLLGILAFVVVMALVASSLREPLETLGKTFVTRFGYAGMAFGTFLADGFHLPPPPQFYMLVSVSSGSPEGSSLLAISIGSTIGGTAGYLVSVRLARLPAVSKRLALSTAFVDRAIARFGYGAALLASFSPIPYSMLCWICGAHRLPVRFFALVLLFRLPRLYLYYWIVRASWLAA